MKRVPDRKRLRREYLRKKGGAYVRFTGNGVLFLLGGGVLFWLIIILGIAVGADLPFTWALLPAVICVAASFAARRTLHGLLKAQEDLMLPYIPPVTPSALPAEEVLVRMAQEPSAPQETLLRATVKGKEAKPEELLRSSQSQ